jgi:aryl-phospho-beta-D-glucosidase BglC (GH1 family)
MLDNPTISGNVTPILDTTFSWDDSYSSASPIGCNPIMNFATTTSFPIYQQQVQQQKAFTFEQPIMTNNDLLVDTNNYWCNNNNNTNDVSLLYQPYPIQPTDQLNYFEYSIPPQYNNDNTAWAFAN